MRPLTPWRFLLKILASSGASALQKRRKAILWTQNLGAVGISILSELPIKRCQRKALLGSCPGVSMYFIKEIRMSFASLEIVWTSLGIFKPLVKQQLPPIPDCFQHRWLPNHVSLLSDVGGRTTVDSLMHEDDTRIFVDYASNGNVLKQMARFIVPSICGHEFIKKKSTPSLNRWSRAQLC